MQTVKKVLFFLGAIVAGALVFTALKFFHVFRGSGNQDGPKVVDTTTGSGTEVDILGEVND